jgi:sulfur carrier protein
LTVTAATKSASEAAAPEIAIEVNAEPQRVRAGTLADVLVALGYGGQKVATALNGAFVPERMRTETPVASGDRIEILSARQGG